MSDVYVGRVLGGKYRLDRLLARGGMGSVWVAHHLQLDAPVAAKLLDPSLAISKDARGRFEREAWAAAKLRSPHVVQIHDHGVDNDTPYIIMELLEGEDVGSRLRRKQRLSLATTSRILSQCCKALRLAHEAGIIHRDLKPGNIFLSKSDGDEVAKILDFGIAKVRGGETVGDHTKTGELIGSPHYMSPEQLRGFKRVDHRTDLWSLAIIAYRALTGRTAFAGDVLGDVIVRICSEPVALPTQVEPSLPPSVDAFFAKALDRDPDKRFQSADEFAAALDLLAAPYPLADDPSLTADPGAPTTARIPSRPSLPHPGPPRPGPPRLPSQPNVPKGGTMVLEELTEEPSGENVLTVDDGGRSMQETALLPETLVDDDEPTPELESPPSSAYTQASPTRKYAAAFAVASIVLVGLVVAAGLRHGTDTTTQSSTPSPDLRRTAQPVEVIQPPAPPPQPARLIDATPPTATPVAAPKPVEPPSVKPAVPTEAETSADRPSVGRTSSAARQGKPSSRRKPVEPAPDTKPAATAKPTSSPKPTNPDILGY